MLQPDIYEKQTSLDRVELTDEFLKACEMAVLLCSLSLNLLDVTEVGDPGLRGTEPDLSARPQLGALFERADAQPIGLCVMGRSGVDRGAAIGTERVCTLITALGRLDVDLGLTRSKLQIPMAKIGTSRNLNTVAKLVEMSSRS
jgi:hypothetical protein